MTFPSRDKLKYQPEDIQIVDENGSIWIQDVSKIDTDHEFLASFPHKGGDEALSRVVNNIVNVVYSLVGDQGWTNEEIQTLKDRLGNEMRLLARRQQN